MDILEIYGWSMDILEIYDHPWIIHPWSIFWFFSFLGWGGSVMWRLPHLAAPPIIAHVMSMNKKRFPWGEYDMQPWLAPMPCWRRIVSARVCMLGDAVAKECQLRPPVGLQDSWHAQVLCHSCVQYAHTPAVSARCPTWLVAHLSTVQIKDVSERAMLSEPKSGTCVCLV